MQFEFKRKSQDFAVSEQLPFTLAGQGDAFYVYFKKRNITTHQVLAHMRKRCKVSRLTLGIAGLKDKRAIAKQWISIYDRALKKLGGEKVFLEALSEVATVIETSRHPFPLNLSTPISNTFHIKFRATKALGKDEKKKARKYVEKMLNKGYPNLFGHQRFGIEGRNITQGREIVQGTLKEKMKPSEKVFKLQAYASKQCNEYIESRVAKKQFLMDGDLLSWMGDKGLKYGFYDEKNSQVQGCDLKGQKGTMTFVPQKAGAPIPYDEKTMRVTVPFPGFNLPVCDPATPAGKVESNFLESRKVDKTMLKVYQDYKVYGLRRALWVNPTQANVRYVGDDLLVDFTLPAGAYASIVFDMLEEKLQ